MLTLLLRFLAVTIVYFVCFVIVSGALLAPAAESSTSAEAGATLAALFVVSLINAAVWSYVILRSRWSGWKLILTIFVVFYGVSTVMPQIESAYFITRLPPGMLPRLFIAGLIMATIFAPLAVLILGKARSSANGSLCLHMTAGEWVGKLALIAVIYVFLYFTFGYFIAWRNPAVRAYYGGGELAGVVTHLAGLLRSEPMLFVFQVVRGLLWAALALPVIKMMKGAWWERALAVALVFAVMTSQLLLPNPLMPTEVRMTHLLETATSNFLFGWLVVLILVSHKKAHKAQMIN